MIKSIHSLRFLFAFLFFFLISSCSSAKNQLVLKDGIADQIIELGKKIDHLYLSMAELPVSERNYARFRDKYVEIEVELLSILDQNKTKKNNETTISDCENVLKTFRKYRDAHKASGTLSDVDLNLNQNTYKDFISRLLDHEVIITTDKK